MSRLLQEPAEGGDLAISIVIYFLIGVFVLSGLVLLVYVLTLLFDKFLPCMPEVDPAIFRSRTIQGSLVARDAGLLGLTREERRSILDKIFVGKPYTKELARSVEEARLQLNSEASTKVSPDDSKISTNTKDSNGTVVPEGSDDVGDVEAPTADTTTSCLICLNSYDGEEVLIGDTCYHMFHKSCLLEWLEKKDICPCCRTPLLTSAQMKAAASEVLSHERLLELSNMAPLYQNGNGGNSQNVASSSASIAPDRAPTDTNATGIEMVSRV